MLAPRGSVDDRDELPELDARNAWVGGEKLARAALRGARLRRSWGRVARLALLPFEVADQRLGLIVEGIQVFPRMLLGVPQKCLEPRLARPRLDRALHPLPEALELWGDAAPDLIVGRGAALGRRGARRPPRARAIAALDALQILLVGAFLRELGAGSLERAPRRLVVLMLSFNSIKRGVVSTGGSTSAMLDRSLMRMNLLIDRSLASVRLEVGNLNLERIVVADVIQEIEIGGAIIAQAKGLRFGVPTVDRTLIVTADRAVLAAAVANLVQNALKFTKPASTVIVDVRASATHVFINVQDECGGLPPGDVDTLLLPFAQRGSDRTGVGLGLAISVRSVNAMNGALRVRDLPGKGCVFTIELPKEPPTPTSIHAREPKGTQEGGGPGGRLAQSS